MRYLSGFFSEKEILGHPSRARAICARLICKNAHPRIEKHAQGRYEDTLWAECLAWGVCRVSHTHGLEEYLRSSLLQVQIRFVDSIAISII